MVDISSQKNSITIKVESTNKTNSITTIPSDPNNSVTTKPDTAQYWSKQSRLSAENSKEFAQESKHYAELANSYIEGFEGVVTNNTNNIIATSNDYINQINNTANEANTTIDTNKNNAINEITTNKNSAVTSVNTTKTSAITEINNTKTTAEESLVAKNLEILTGLESAKADKLQELENKGNEVIADVTDVSNKSIAKIENTSNNAVNTVNSSLEEYTEITEQLKAESGENARIAKEQAEIATTKANAAAASALVATEQATIATEQATIATNQAESARLEAIEATEQARNALASSESAKTSENNAKASESNALASELSANEYKLRCEEIFQRIGTVIKIKGRVNNYDDLPTKNNIDGDAYLVGADGLDAYPEYYWFVDHWEYLGTSATSLLWGSISGTLANQTDLQNALNGKANDSTVVHKTGNETIAGDKTFSNTISAEHGKFGKKLTTYRYRSDETPTTTYYWYKIFQSSTSSQCVNFEIMAHSDNNYPQFAKYTISVSNYTKTSTSIVVYNHGKIGATPNIKVAIDADGNVYLQANCIWDCVLTANNVYGNATVPYTNMGYGAFGTPVGFTSIGMITSTGALRYLKTTGTVTYSTPEIDALATKATADASGNTITSTYRKISDSYTKTDVYNKAELDTILAKRGDVHNMFDTVLKDHVLSYEESKGLALQGTYVYKDAIAGSRYGYPDFYAKCVEEFQDASNTKQWLKSNVTKVGSVVDNQGILSEFSSSNYATLPISFGSSGNTWESVICFTTGTDVTTSQLIQCNSVAYWGYGVGIASGKLRIGLSSSTSSFTITENTSTVVQSNTKYWVKTTFNGSSYTCSYSIDGVVWSNIFNITSTSSISSGTPRLGLNDGGIYSFLGLIDLNESYININGSRWWTGVDTVIKNPNGHLFYDISQKDQVDELFASTGRAWFYGIDTENERIFLPRNSKYFRIGDESTVGTNQDAGLPNITGNIRFAGIDGWANSSGVFTQGLTSGAGRGHNGNQGSCDVTYYFNASRSSSLYGNSDTVELDSVNMLLYICVGNTESEEALTNVTEISTTENDTLPLLHHIPADELLEHPSWLRSAGQWNDGNVYTYAYSYLVNEYMFGTEHTDTLTTPDGTAYTVTYKTIKGKKVVDVANVSQVDAVYSAIGSAWYYVINQDDMAFRLPMSHNSECYTSDPTRVGLDVAAGLPNITGSFTYSRAYSQSDIDGGAVSTSQLNTGGWNAGSYSWSNRRAALNASNSNPIYGNSDTVTPPHTEFYLYFKVANAVQNLELLNAGEVLEAVNNVVPNNRTVITTWGFPSSKYIDLTLGASGTTYTAPANGWYYLKGKATANNGWIDWVVSNEMYGGNPNNTNTGNVKALIPITKGYTAQIFYGNFNKLQFRFIYAEGDQ